MRRYSIRILVALLTFAVGVSLSLLLGAFSFSNKLSVLPYRSSRCSRTARLMATMPSMPTVDIQRGEPLQLVDLKMITNSSTPESFRVDVVLQNRTDKTISGYLVGSINTLRTREKSSVIFSDQSSSIPLRPFESRRLIFDSAANMPMVLRVDAVTFADGSTWRNERSQAASRWE